MIQVQLWQQDTRKAEHQVVTEAEADALIDKIITDTLQGLYGTGEFELMADQIAEDGTRGFLGAYWHSPKFYYPKEKAAT